MMTPCAALIVGGGLGSRFGGDKLMVPLAGAPLLSWTLRAFQDTPAISFIILVAPAGLEAKFRDIAREWGVTKLLSIVSGGQQRYESVLRGLTALLNHQPEAALVAIHDAARPLVTPDLITRCIERASESGAAAAGVPVSDSLHVADQEGCAMQTVDRTGLWAMQTPQVFHPSPLASLLGNSSGGIPSDEVAVALSAGWKIPFVRSHLPNPKVTWPEDLMLAEALLKARLDRISSL